ncbi:MAG TPA: translesion DNA synthesis-associated protein ImuA [Burkholderiaceae bacterium]|nr:translesion DNA synthesis-associated protein ImuA [Burkholderiaceae bacterium]
MSVESSLAGTVWRASQLAQNGVEALSSGFRALDAELPGAGWPLGMLTELIAREPGIGELRLLVPLLRQVTREHRLAILLAPLHIPYAPALKSFGIDPDCLLVVQAPNPADRLWAVEQAIRSASFGALLAWLPQDRCRPEHLRRLQAAARGARGPVFLFRQLPAQFQPSPAPLRLLMLPSPDQQLSVQLLKRRGPVLARPIILELPKPLLAIRLRASSRSPELAKSASATSSSIGAPRGSQRDVPWQPTLN